MKVRLISHASVIIEAEDCTIWTDPWLFGKAFMNAWSLLPKAYWEDHFYNEIDFVWVSHEHPDHFNFPTLKAMPADFKARVPLLFQKSNSNKMPEAFSKLGFKNITLLPHRKIVSITPKTKVHCCQIGPTPDSSLAVINDHYTILNLNDCEANAQDCKLFVKDLGKVNLLLNQFSIAGYRGHYDYATHLRKKANIILENMVENHKDINADVTIPFASFVYFSDSDNKYVNKYANTVMDVKTIFDRHHLKTAILYPGDVFDSEKEFDSDPAIEKYAKMYQSLDELEYRQPPVFELDELKKAFTGRSKQLREKYPDWLLKKLKPIIIKISDLHESVRVSLYNGTFEKVSTGDFDLIMGSEAFHYAFANTWGIGTIGVGAKYLVKNKWNVWKWYKIFATLNNAQFYLKTKYLFTKNNLNFILSRMEGGFNQLAYKWKRMDI